MTRSDKKHHFHQLYEKMQNKNDTKGLYRSIKTQLGWKNSGPPQSLDVEGRKITAPRDIANEQMNFFKKKIEKLMSEIPRPTQDPLKTLQLAIDRWSSKAGNRETFSLKEVCVGDILSVINKMGNSSAMSHDFLDSISIKAASEILAPPITFLTNLSISQSKFAKAWKKAKIIPIYKGKETSRTATKSYRPIAILPPVSKIVEKVIHLQILSYMERSHQFNQNLHGYRNNHSTTTALLQLSNSILQATDSNLISTLVTIDESAAFDCVNFKILQKKLQLYNFDQKTRDWIDNYLDSRLQYVEIGVKKSDTMEIKQGVPQGSILGPLIFSIYTNELPAVVRQPNCQDPAHREQDFLFGDNCRNCGSVPSYADDATFVIESKNREISQSKIEEATTSMKNFLNSQDLCVNMEKTCILETMVKQKRSRIKGVQPSLSIQMESGETTTILPKKYVRLLGMNLEDNLAWNSHLLNGEKSILPALRKQLGALKHIISLVRQIPMKSRRTLANGLIVSRIIYGITIWSGTYATNIRKMQAILNKTARWITNSGRRTSTKVLMEKCQWMSIVEMSKMYSLIMLWKIIWLRIPKQLRDQITLEDDFTVTTVRPRLQTCRLGFTWRTTTMWNSLPLNIRNIKSLPKFKKSLKLHILSTRVTSVHNTSVQNLLQVDGSNDIENTSLTEDKENNEVTTDQITDTIDRNTDSMYTNSEVIPDQEVGDWSMKDGTRTEVFQVDGGAESSLLNGVVTSETRVNLWVNRDNTMETMDTLAGDADMDALETGC